MLLYLPLLISEKDSTMLFAKEKSFDQIYSNVPEEQKEMLLQFRENAAYHQITLDDQIWQYRVIGHGSQIMILLPGSFTLADMWMQIALGFEQNYRILIPDAYARQRWFDIEKVCQAIISMMDAQQAKQAIFIGLGAGADLAQYFLHQHPQRVAQLILSHCEVLGDSSSRDDTRQQRTLGFYKRTGEKSIRKMMLRQLENGLPIDSKWRTFTAAYYRESIQGLKKDMVLAYIKNSYAMKKNFEFSVSRIHNWQGNILYLASDDDNITVESITPLKKLYPKTKVHRFPSGKNHVHLLFADQVVKVIAAFLDGVQSKEVI